MDNAVALVEAYLRVNGYFTVAEYPVLEAARDGFRAATDLDILAVRFPRAGRLITGRGPGYDRHRFTTDPALDIAPEQIDMIIGEVKEGRGRLNAAMRDPRVLEAALLRFGCTSEEETPRVVDDINRAGSAMLESGHRVRLVIFASVAEERGIPTIGLGHIVEFLQGYLREHWEPLRTAQFSDPVFGFLATLEKAARGRAPKENA
jgi:hypothetical protein